jgi:hypothetical protein
MPSPEPPCDDLYRRLVTSELPVARPEPVVELEPLSIRYTCPPYDMRRAILLLMLGIFCGALFTAAISVYIFHDVDKDEIGHWNEAFTGSCTEFVLFTLIIGGGVALLVFLGRTLFHLKGYSPRFNLVFPLGIGVSLLQYPWDFIGRVLFPKFTDFSLSLYLLLAIVVCAIVIVRDSFRQMKLSQAQG